MHYLPTSSAVYFPDTVEIGNKSYPIDYIVCDSPVMEGGENIKVQQGAGMAVTKSDEEHEYVASVFPEMVHTEEPEPALLYANPPICRF